MSDPIDRIPSFLLRGKYRELAAERDAALALVGQLQGQLDAARAWLKSADPYRERNGDHFAELRAILAAARAVKVYERVNCDEPQSEGECYVDHEHGF